jgi:hypothetical protein
MVPMAEKKTYLWLIEWEDSMKPKRVEVRHVARLSGVGDDDLERFLIEEAVPAKATELTRLGGPARQTILRLTGERTQATGFANTDEGVALLLGDVAVSIGWNAEVVWSSGSDSEVDPGTSET